jgi:hypothetical protein
MMNLNTISLPTKARPTIEAQYDEVCCRERAEHVRLMPEVVGILEIDIKRYYLFF